jgi:hypothetical protein
MGGSRINREIGDLDNQNSQFEREKPQGRLIPKGDYLLNINKSIIVLMMMTESRCTAM